MPPRHQIIISLKYEFEIHQIINIKYKIKPKFKRKPDERRLKFFDKLFGGQFWRDGCFIFFSGRALKVCCVMSCYPVIRVGVGGGGSGQLDRENNGKGWMEQERGKQARAHQRDAVRTVQYVHTT